MHTLSTLSLDEALELFIQAITKSAKTRQMYNKSIFPHFTFIKCVDGLEKGSTRTADHYHRLNRP